MEDDKDDEGNKGEKGKKQISLSQFLVQREKKGQFIKKHKVASHNQSVKKRRKKKNNSNANVTTPPARSTRSKPLQQFVTPSQSIYSSARNPTQSEVHIGNSFSRYSIHERTSKELSLDKEPVPNAKDPGPEVGQPDHYKTISVGKDIELAGDGTAKQVPMNSDEGRCCYCDYDHTVSCKNCTNIKLCEEHEGRQCSSCNVWFHNGCTGWKFDNSKGLGYPSYSRSDPIDVTKGWYCIRCWEKKTKDEDDIPFHKCKTEEKFFRLGQIVPSNVTGSQLNRRIATLRTTIFEAVQDKDLVYSILNTHPRPFPTALPMIKKNREEHARLGRLFEIELLCLKVRACACCGRTKPTAEGPMKSVKKRDTNFHRQSLVETYHPAFHCKCDICNDHFFSTGRRSHIRAYQEKHGENKIILPNCELCGSCYSEFHSTPELLFQVSRKFSSRNGFGPFPRTVTDCPDGYSIANTSSYLTLMPSHIHHLLGISTLAEEAAYRQITPIITLIRMKGNNLARKGVVSLVHQESKLQKVLPNLPQSCVTCVFQYSSKKRKNKNKENDLRSFRCRRLVIQRVLEIFRMIANDIPEWKVEVSEEHLSKWPTEGNLLDHVHHAQEKEDKDEEPHDSTKDCLGPAPLQNVDGPEEEFVTILPSKEGLNNSSCEAASNILEEFGAHIVGDTVKLQQKEVLPTGNFVDMKKQGYVGR